MISEWPVRRFETGEKNDVAAGAAIPPQAYVSEVAAVATTSRQSMDKKEPLEPPSSAQDAVMQSIVTRIDELQADLRSARTQIAQLSGENAASADAMRASQVLATDRGKMIESARAQEAALRNELAALRRQNAGSAQEARNGATPPSASTQDAKAGGTVSVAQKDSEHRSLDLPAGARTQVNVTFALGRSAARSKALALTSTLAGSGIRATEPVGVESTTPGVHVTYAYRQDQSAADKITKMLLVPDSTWKRRAQLQSVRPGTIELFVGS